MREASESWQWRTMKIDGSSNVRETGIKRRVCEPDEENVAGAKGVRRVMVRSHDYKDVGFATKARGVGVVATVGMVEMASG